MTTNGPFTSKVLVAILAVSAALAAGGCGPGLPETAPVQGTVTYDGKPVTQGKIAFFPETGRPASGQIQPDGTYTLTTFSTDDGALLGKHVVTIESMTSTGGEQPKSFEQEMARALDPTKRPPGQPVAKWLVPERYSNRNTSGLTAEVAPGKNTLDFNLPAAAR